MSNTSCIFTIIFQILFEQVPLEYSCAHTVLTLKHYSHTPLCSAGQLAHCQSVHSFPVEYDGIAPLKAHLNKQHRYHHQHICINTHKPHRVIMHKQSPCTQICSILFLFAVIRVFFLFSFVPSVFSTVHVASLCCVDWLMGS